MKSNIYRAIRCRVGFLALLTTAFALLSGGPAASKDRIYHKPGTGETPECVVVEANIIEGSLSCDGKPRIHAYGNVSFRQGTKLLTGEEFLYNGSDNTGILTKATFTTCTAATPDYHVTAHELRLTPNQKVILKHASIYLGQFKLITLPKLTMDVSPNTHRKSFLPRVRVTKRDGLVVGKSFSVLDTGSDQVNAKIAFTQLRGIHAAITGGHAIEGNALMSPPYIPDAGTELRSAQILQPTEDEQSSAVVFRGTTAEPRLVSLFGALMVRDPTPDIDNPDILVTRLPEVGVRFVSRPRSFIHSDTPEDPLALGLQGQVRASWARLKESPGNLGFINRSDIRGTASSNLARLGRSSALRGAVLGRYSDYSNGDTYSVIGAAIDASRLFRHGSFASARYITQAVGGSTPFMFDDIDLKREIQGAGRYVTGKYRFTGLLDFDVDHCALRDWQILVAHRTDCLETSLGFNQGLKQVTANINFIGF